MPFTQHSRLSHMLCSSGCAALAVNNNNTMPILCQLKLSKAHLNIHTGRRVVLDYDLLKDRRCGPYCLDSHTAESCLHIPQGVFSHQPHPVHYLVLQPLVHCTGIVCESLQRQDTRPQSKSNNCWLATVTLELFRNRMLEVGQPMKKPAQLGCCTAIVW